MFTGLVETVGTVHDAIGASPRRLTIEAELNVTEVAIGDSIAIDGCCLTVVAKQGRGLTFEAATETLKRTTLGELTAGSAVNLEQSLRVGERLGGHLVMGHVDGVGAVRSVEQRDSAWYIAIQAPTALAPFIASQGSITVAGVSLTVTDVRDDVFSVAIIPHTWQVTTLRALQPGSRVNLEVDVVARYVGRLLESAGKI